MNESHHQHQQVVNINTEVTAPEQPRGLKTIIYSPRILLHPINVMILNAAFPGFLFLLVKAKLVTSTESSGVTCTSHIVTPQLESAWKSRLLQSHKYQTIILYGDALFQSEEATTQILMPENKA